MSLNVPMSQNGIVVGEYPPRRTAKKCGTCQTHGGMLSTCCVGVSSSYGWIVGLSSTRSPLLWGFCRVPLSKWSNRAPRKLHCNNLPLLEYILKLANRIYERHYCAMIFMIRSCSDSAFAE